MIILYEIRLDPRFGKALDVQALESDERDPREVLKQAGKELVRSGPFAITPNAMYAIGFLGLWGIACLFGSWNALVVALFQHAYIWVHMYCTEAPDMDWIYGDRLERAAATQA